MDTLDQQLLALLRLDARASVATLALKLKVSRGTVSNRIARLEDGGVINGYTVRLRPDAVSDEITAWMSIAVEGNRTREVISILLGEPGVTGLFDTNGRWDLLAELRAPSLNELAAVLERVRLIKGIGATETSIHLQSYKLS
ncbi:MAG: Lrp/AsnC family transcriptional regulator [Burkholderiaceae bacterium]